MKARRRACLSAGLALCMLGCGKREPAPAARETAELTVDTATPAPNAPQPAAKARACRVMSLVGSVVTATGEVIEKGRLLDGERWLVLAPGSSLAIKHTSSGREVTFEGPGRILPCVAGEEEMIIGSGTISTQANIGVRPGATVLIGTPFGSVRYADAQARLVVSDQGLELPEASGDLVLVPVLPPAEPIHLSAHGAMPPGAAPSADAALDACAHSAEAAREKARALLAATSGALGPLAGEHVRARLAARLTCAAATAAALAQGKDAGEIAARLLRLRELRAVWRGVPER